MELHTLEELLESLKESVDSELDSEGLATWSINASGENFTDNFAHYSLQDLQDLQVELTEGARCEITIDLSEFLLDHVNQLVEDKESQEEDDLFEEDESDYSYDED